LGRERHPFRGLPRAHALADPWTLLVDTFAIAYPSRRYESTWIGIVVHSSQSVFFSVIILTLVL
jgi:hypothetical protein